MKKNEALNFEKQYKHSVCFNGNLEPVKLLECLEQDGLYYFAVLTNFGQRENVLCSEPIIPLRGRLKGKDYDLIEAKFNNLVAKSKAS